MKRFINRVQMATIIILFFSISLAGCTAEHVSSESGNQVNSANVNSGAASSNVVYQEEDFLSYFYLLTEFIYEPSELSSAQTIDLAIYMCGRDPNVKASESDPRLPRDLISDWTVNLFNQPLDMNLVLDKNLSYHLFRGYDSTTDMVDCYPFSDSGAIWGYAVDHDTVAIEQNGNVLSVNGQINRIHDLGIYEPYKSVRYQFEIAHTDSEIEYYRFISIEEL